MIQSLRDEGDRASTLVPLGSIMLDDVAYRPGQHEVHHCEIEVEGAGADPTTRERLEPLVVWLRERYGERLVPWKTNKLAMGIALEQLERKDELSPWMVTAPDERVRLAESFYREGPLRRA